MAEHLAADTSFPVASQVPTVPLHARYTPYYNESFRTHIDTTAGHRDRFATWSQAGARVTKYMPDESGAQPFTVYYNKNPDAHSRMEATNT